MKTIVILMDSLNREMLSIYNKNSWVKTPNIERLAEKSVIFNNHWLGSAPCMPARRDIFTGRLNFLERGWGPIEPFDITLQECLRKSDIFTHITTDHNHYTEIGGEGYMQLFNTWDMHRGQEFDPWVSKVAQPELPKEYLGKVHKQYELNRTLFNGDRDYPTPRTFESAAQWLEVNKDSNNYLLMVEAFDPHEPFDCPEEYLDMYLDDYDGPHFNWSTYDRVTESYEAIKHLQKTYAATLTMADKWLGKMLDVLDKYNMWKDHLIIFTTDHGHLLGEHGWTGKNIMHAYNELAHLPMLIHLPGSISSGKRVDGLTQNIDLMPTILDYYGLEIPNSVNGKSLKGILEGTISSVRDAAIYGWHGKAINITDGKYTYFRAPVNKKNLPCFHYFSMPTTIWSYMGREVAESIEMGRFLYHTDYPVYKMEATYREQEIDNILETQLFDIEKDYYQQKPLDNKSIEKYMTNKLIYEMVEASSPIEQFKRVGLVNTKI